MTGTSERDNTGTNGTNGTEKASRDRDKRDRGISLSRLSRFGLVPVMVTQ